MSAPAWSVIVPTCNRPRQLAECVAALRQLEPPVGGFEIVIVNDGGANFDDDLRRAAEASVSPRIRLLRQERAGPGVARNTGAEAAAGVWLAFTDDDCLPVTGWLRAFERALAGQPDALVGGVTRNVLRDSIFSETSQLLVGFISDWFDGRSRERMFTSNNIALARARFIESGAFDPSFGVPAAEDREFCDRWSAQARPSVAAADAIVGHAHALSLRSFLRQHFSYGRAGRRFRTVRSAVGRPIRIEPAFYLASLRYAARGKPMVRGAALAGWTLVAHVAYAAGLAREVLRRNSHAAQRN